MTEKFDPIHLEILWRRLISIVDEADASVARTAFSSLLRDAHDYTCMFTDARGRELAQGTFCTPGQAGAMALGVKRIIQSLPVEHYGPGDVFIVNDPWLLAGHLNAKKVEFAKPEEVLQLVGCEVGCVPPFGHLTEIPIYMDKDLMKKDRVYSIQESMINPSG